MATGDQAMALRLYQAVLTVEPNQAEALAYGGWLLRLSGDVRHDRTLIEAAVADERAAEAADPAYPDPHFFLGLILLDDLHDPVSAIPQLTAYLGSSPSPAVRKAVEPVLARARQEAGQGPALGAGAGPAP
jgi:tetratricopeptide (TPR) repeat protein